MKLISVATAAILLMAPVSQAQNWRVTEDHPDCSRKSWQRHCEVRQATVPSTGGTLRIDGGLNGGIRVEGVSGSETRVEAIVTIHDRISRDRAAELASRIEIIADGETIRAEGPDRGSGWSVSFRVSVPHNSDLDLRTHNGGVSIEGIDGRVEFDVLNGGVKLREMAGEVRGHTTNGGLNVELDGSEWSGETLDVRTTNGGVKLWIPEEYSAELVTGTVNGNMRFDFPVRVQGDMRKSLRTTLGHGGPRVSVRTTNGSVTVGRP